MADIVVNTSFGAVKYKDMGDGTQAEVTYMGGGAQGTAANQVQGTTASGTADTGNPVKVGGRYNVSPPTLTDGQRGDLQLDINGRLLTNSAPLTGAADTVAINDGSTTANVAAVGSGQNALITGGGYNESTFTTTTAQTVASADVSAYKWISVHIVAQGGSSNVTFQASNDNNNWVTTQLQSLTGAPVGSTTSTGIYMGPVAFRYFRLNVTGIASGTTSGVIEKYTSNSAQINNNTTVYANQNGTWNTAVSATPSVSTVSVSNSSSTSVLNSNASRKALIFSNVGSNNIYINLAGGTAITTNTLLVPNGILVIDRYVPTTAITAIAATGATNLSVTELA